MRRTGNQTVALIVGGILALPALGAATSDQDEQLTNIVVVGQKENRGLQVAPEAITAITGDALAQDAIRNATDLNGMVPGLVIGESDGYNFDLTIRGIGLNSPQDDGSPASVSLHQNGFFIPNPLALSLGFLDVDHIEVLRGPQGTVFGQNSVGGTLNIITVQPTLDGVKGYANAEFGSLNLVHLRAAVNLPASSTFAIRLAGDYDKQDGYAHATAVPGNFQLNDVNNYQVRISALWQPNEDFSLIGTLERSRVGQHEPESKNILDTNTSPYQESSDWPGLYNIDQTIETLTATVNLNAMTFKSLTSIQDMNHSGSNSESGLTIPVATNLYGGENDQYTQHKNYAVTQEFDLSSKPGGRFDWVVGAFYLESHTADAYAQYLLNPSQPGAPNTIGLPDPAAEALAGPEISAGTLYFESANWLRRTSVSGFGQASYHLNDEVRATAGFRYTTDRNSTVLDNYYGDPALGGGIVHLHQSSSKLTWKLGIEDQLTHDNLLYASISTGFKPGGGNPGTAPAVVPANYAPETITSFEVGSKNSLFDNTFIANLAAFYYIDKNMQYHAEDLVNFDGGVDNLPQVNIYGLEGEFTALLPAHFRLDAALTAQQGRIATHISTLDNLAGNAANTAFQNQYGFADFLAAEFGQTCADVPNCVGVLSAMRAKGYRDVYGNAPPNLPKYTATVSLSQTSKFPDGSSLLSRFGIIYRDQYADTVFGNSFYYTTPSYVMMNLFFDYTFANRNLDLTLGVSNLANREEVSYRFTNQYGGETTQNWFAPREYRVGLAYKF